MPGYVRAGVRSAIWQGTGRFLFPPGQHPRRGRSVQKYEEEIIELLKLSNRSMKQTILLVTHDEQVALEADRIITIEDGSICSDKAVK
jgi:hypothetical protein